MAATTEVTQTIYLFFIQKHISAKNILIINIDLLILTDKYITSLTKKI